MKRAGRVGGGPRSKPSTMIGQRMQRAAECRCSASRAPLSLLSALQTQKEKASFGGLAGRKPQPQADERYRDPQDARSRAGDPLRAVGGSSTLHSSGTATLGWSVVRARRACAVGALMGAGVGWHRRSPHTIASKCSACPSPSATPGGTCAKSRCRCGYILGRRGVERTARRTTRAGTALSARACRTCARVPVQCGKLR